MSQRAPHPDDCRDALRELAERREEHAREHEALTADLGREARVAQTAGLSVTEIAELAGVSRQTVYAAMGTPEPGTEVAGAARSAPSPPPRPSS